MTHNKNKIELKELYSEVSKYYRITSNSLMYRVEKYVPCGFFWRKLKWKPIYTHYYGSDYLDGSIVAEFHSYDRAQQFMEDRISEDVAVIYGWREIGINESKSIS